MQLQNLFKSQNFARYFQFIPWNEVIAAETFCYWTSAQEMGFTVAVFFGNNDKQNMWDGAHRQKQKGRLRVQEWEEDLIWTQSLRSEQGWQVWERWAQSFWNGENGEMIQGQECNREHDSNITVCINRPLLNDYFKKQQNTVKILFILTYWDCNHFIYEQFSSFSSPSILPNPKQNHLLCFFKKEIKCGSFHNLTYYLNVNTECKQRTKTTGAIRDLTISGRMRALKYCVKYIPLQLNRVTFVFSGCTRSSMEIAQINTPSFTFKPSKD